MVRLNMTEKLFTGTLNQNQNKTKQNFGFDGWIWVLIASVPDLCILFTFMKLKPTVWERAAHSVYRMFSLYFDFL